MPDQVNHTSDGELSTSDAILQGIDGGWWDEFFADRAKPIAFFKEWPDENLDEWFSGGLLSPGRVLELGCGNGRNAIYLAGRGCTVDAVDFSAQAIGWARERAEAAGAAVVFHRCSIFDEAKAASRRLAHPLPNCPVRQHIPIGAPPLHLPALELLLVQRRVQPAAAQQLLVRPRLHHLAAVDHVDHVRADDRRQPVRDRDRGP
jgi:SAM-dependent methyltransferase